MKIAFLGGTRFIGHAAAARAADRGHEVFVLHRGKHPSELVAAQPIAVDRADPSALCETLARLRPDALIDTHAMTRVDAEVTALAAKVLKLPVVVLSSVDVYAQLGRLNGLPAPAPEAAVSESSPLTIPYPFRDLGPHEGGPDYDKKDVEAILAAAAGEAAGAVTILRLPIVYGARDHNRRFGAIVDALDAGAEALPCAGGAALRLSHAHVADVAEAIVLATERQRGGAQIYNVAEAAVPTMRERVDALAAAMGARFRWEERDDPLPPAFELLGRFPNDFIADTSKIRAALGYREVTTERERMEDTVAWLRASRPPPAA
jgi:nucleoside-diphosphate-sugar epimerase